MSYTRNSQDLKVLDLTDEQLVDLLPFLEDVCETLSLASITSLAHYGEPAFDVARDAANRVAESVSRALARAADLAPEQVTQPELVATARATIAMMAAPVEQRREVFMAEVEKLAPGFMDNIRSAVEAAESAQADKPQSWGGLQL